MKNKFNEKTVNPQQMLEMIGSLATAVADTQKALLHITETQIKQVNTINSISDSLEKVCKLIKDIKENK